MRKYTIPLRSTLIPITLFYFELWLVASIDKHLRLADGNIHTNGLPEVIWFASHGLCALLPIALMINATRHIKPLWGKLLIITATVIIGWLLYIFTVLHYITSNGIDTL